MKIKSKKSALLLSFTSLLLCFAMLAGSTFAWFTDTATTGVNQIKSGKLDVGLEMKNPDYDPEVEGSKEWINAEGKTLEFVKAAGAAENEAVLWEPNCTYKLPELRVVNNGNLALKYKVVITGIQGDAKLNKAITWSIVEGAEANAIKKNDVATGEYFLLPAGETTAPLTIKGEMDKNAGNEYQNLTIDGISITVLATQYTHEKDSIGDQYDKDAGYDPEPITAEELRKIFVDETTGRLKQEVKLEKDYLLTDAWTPFTIWEENEKPENGRATIDGQGHTIYNMTVNGGEKLGFIGVNGADLTIKNLTFSNATVVGTGSFLGVVIGYQYGEVTLDNVQVVNSVVKSTAEGIRIGGLVGFSVLHDGAKLHLKDCTVKNSNFEGFHNTCGLVGTLIKYSENLDKYSISGCTVSGCTFLWGSKNTTYNNFAVSEGGPYNAQYDAIISGVTAMNNSFEYKK